MSFSQMFWVVVSRFAVGIGVGALIAQVLKDIT